MPPPAMITGKFEAALAVIQLADTVELVAGDGGNKRLDRAIHGIGFDFLQMEMIKRFALLWLHFFGRDADRMLCAVVFRDTPDRTRQAKDTHAWPHSAGERYPWHFGLRKTVVCSGMPGGLARIAGSPRRHRDMWFDTVFAVAKILEEAG